MVTNNDNPYRPPNGGFPEDDIPIEEPFGYWPIPQQFHSLELDGPFRQCLICNASLLDGLSEHSYMIERIFRGTEPIIEYALCFACQQSMNEEMSAESSQTLAQIFSNVPIMARHQRLQHHVHDQSIDPWLEQCFLTGKPRSECHGYQIVGRFLDSNIEVSLFPIMLSDDAVKMISQQLSKQTRDRFDDFMKNFSMPPEFSADFPPIIF